MVQTLTGPRLARALRAGALAVVREQESLNRINVFLISYRPLYPEKSYFPSPFEILVTVGLISTLVLVYRAIVMIFPVIAAAPEEAPREVLVAAPASEPEGATQ